MNYDDVLEYLYSQLPMFHRVGAAAYKANLDNIRALSTLVGNPEKNLQTVHIAGTNGKGSVSNMLASVFQEAGYKTGLFTSPHLKDFRERIRINGKMIDKESIISFVEKYKTPFEKINPSFFEWTTALAFSYFQQNKTDVAIIETGLGGRLDSTNIITPVLSVITNISYDHMNLLGNSLDEIAFEKAGIIKKNIPVVIGERQKEIESVFINAAGNKNAELFFASDRYSAGIKNTNKNFAEFEIQNLLTHSSEIIETGLTGNYQEKNICTVIQSAELLKERFKLINEQSISSGIRNVKDNTGIRGRWEILSESPLIIADVAHNESGIKMVIDQLNKIEFNQLHIVIGMVNDKDISKVLLLLPTNAKYYFCKADIPRALNADELREAAIKFNLSGNVYSSVKEAYSSAKKNAAANDLIYIGGSTFVVAEVI